MKTYLCEFNLNKEPQVQILTGSSIDEVKKIVIESYSGVINDEWCEPKSIRIKRLYA